MSKATSSNRRKSVTRKPYNPDEWMTVAQQALITKTGKTSIYRDIEARIIPHERFGPRRVRIPMSWLREVEAAARQ